MLNFPSPRSSLRSSFPPARLALILLLWSATVLTSAASAQPLPIPGLNPGGQLGHDWDVTNDDLSNVAIHDLKKSYREGVKALRAGECRSASNKLDFVVEHIKHDATVHYVAATAARCLKQFRKAAKHYEAVLAADPSHYPSYRFLGVSLLAVGNFDEATRRFADLESRRLDCDPGCGAEMEDSYANLRKALDYVTEMRLSKKAP